MSGSVRTQAERHLLSRRFGSDSNHLKLLSSARGRYVRYVIVLEGLSMSGCLTLQAVRDPISDCVQNSDVSSLLTPSRGTSRKTSLPGR